MKHRLQRQLASIGHRLGKSPVANLPGVRTAYYSLQQMLVPDRASDVRWIDYEGYELKVAPPDHVSVQLVETGVYEWNVRIAIIEQVAEGQTVLDIGGHIGHHTLTLRDCVGDSGEVYVFEPNPENAKMISDTVQQNGIENVKIIEKGVGKSTGRRRLHVANENTGAASIFSLRKDLETIEINMTRYDEFSQEYEVSHVDFIKMDIEGAEKEVIPELNLSSIDTMLLEIHCKNHLTEGEIRKICTRLADKGKLEGLDGKKIGSFTELNFDQNHTLLWTRDG